MAGGLLLSSALVALGGGPADAQADKSPVKVAVIADQSGVLGVSGKASLSGVQTAAKLINDQGGINGHPVVVKSYDGQSNTAVASSMVRSAVADGADVLSGFVNGVELLPSVPVLAQAKIPFAYSGNYLTDWQSLPLFVMTSTNQDAGKIVTNAFKQLLGGSLKGKTLAVAAATPSASYDETIVSMKAAIKKEGGNLARVIRDPLSINSWTSQAANIMNANVDAIMMLAPESSAVVIGKALTVAGFKGKILASVLSATDGTFNTLKLPNVYGLRENGQPSPGTPLYKAVLDAKASTSKALGSPLLFARGYAGMWTAARTLQKCGLPCPGPKFISVLKTLGPINIPLSPYYGVPNFTKGVTGVNGQQLWHYDPASGKPAPLGKVIDAG